MLSLPVVSFTDGGVCHPLLGSLYSFVLFAGLSPFPFASGRAVRSPMSFRSTGEFGWPFQLWVFCSFFSLYSGVWACVPRPQVLSPPLPGRDYTLGSCSFCLTSVIFIGRPFGFQPLPFLFCVSCSVSPFPCSPILLRCSLCCLSSSGSNVILSFVSS